MKQLKRMLICMAMLVSATCIPPITANVRGREEEPGGKAFTEPALTLPMGDAWLKRPIAYLPEDADADLSVTLNQQFFEFMLPHVEQYARENNLKIQVHKGTCGISSGQLAKKQIDIGAFCCPPAPSDRLPGLVFHTVGIHPISILVHPDNPVTDLTMDQIRKIFRGDIHRWSELGGKDQPIQVVIRLHCKNRPGHWRLLLDDADFFSPVAQSVGTIEDVFTLIAANPDAIGFEGLWLSDQYRRAGKVKTVNIDNIPPDEPSFLLNGSYPLYRVLSITTWEDGLLGKPHGHELAEYMIDKVDHYGALQGIIPSSQLRKAGWQFRGDELIGRSE